MPFRLLAGKTKPAPPFQLLLILAATLLSWSTYAVAQPKQFGIGKDTFKAAIAAQASGGAVTTELTAVPSETFVANYLWFAKQQPDGSCVTIPDQPTLTSPPTQGNALITSANLYDANCSLTVISSPVVTYAWGLQTTALSDSFNVNYNVPPPVNSAPATVNIKRLALRVNSIDISNGVADLDVSAGHSDSLGLATLNFVGTAASYVVSFPQLLPPGNHVLIPFDATPVKTGSYSSVIVAWNAKVARPDATAPNGYTVKDYFVSDTYKSLDWKKDSGCTDCSASVGDSINVGTGNSFDYESDVDSLAGFTFQRVYNSQGASVDELGAGWTSNASKSIALVASVSPRRSFVKREDGTVYSFSEAGAAGSTAAWTSDADSTLKLYAVYGNGGTTPTALRLYTRTNHLEVYDGQGLLASDTPASGKTLSFTRDTSGKLSKITDFTGRAMQFSYDAQSHLSLITNPDSSTIKYQVDSVTGDLTDVFYEDSTNHVTYAYNEQAHTNGVDLPHALTSKTDPSGASEASWNFDAQRRVTAAQRTGLPALTVTYDSSTQTSYTDPAGQSRQLAISRLNGVTKVGQSSAPRYDTGTVPFLSRAFDAAGNVTTHVDFDGRRSCMAYVAARNLEAVRLEGLTSASSCPSDLAGYAIPTGVIARKISTQWHPDWRLPVAEAKPKVITRWYYNGQPNPASPGTNFSCTPAGAALPDGKPLAVVCKVVEQATTDASGTLGFAAASDGTPRSSTFTYNANGQLLVATDPRLKPALTNVYYSDSSYDANGLGHSPGDLKTSMTASGQTTTFGTYDRRGLVRQSTDANGTVTTRTYWPRGWLQSVQVMPASGGGAAQQTQYDYYPHGELKTVTNADGTQLSFQYDLAHRLTDATDGAGNTAHYDLDALGNRLNETLKDSSGTLAQNVQRVYDTLGRQQSLKVLGSGN